MQSEVVTFTFTFPSRRQLQTAATTFMQQLISSVAASLGVPESSVTVSLVANTTNSYEVSIIQFSNLAVTPTEVVAAASTPSFLNAVGSAVGSTPTLETPPAIGMVVTPVPSPPPPFPPPGPPPPPPLLPWSSPVNQIHSGSSSQSNLGTATDGTGLSKEMLWVIIIAVIVVMVVLGCLAAFCYGKRISKGQYPSAPGAAGGRPGLRRQVSPEEEREARARRAAAAAEGEPSPQGDAAVTNVRMQDVRLIELGMAVERTMAITRQPSGGSPAHPHIPREQMGAGPSSSSATNIENRLAGMQGAINDIREALTPKSAAAQGREVSRRESMPRRPSREDSEGREVPVWERQEGQGSPSTSQSRIRKEADLGI